MIWNLETEVILTEEQTLRKFPWLKGGLGNCASVNFRDHDDVLIQISEVSIKETHQVVKVETRDGGVHGYFVKPITESLVYTDEECWNREVWGSEEQCKEWAEIMNESFNRSLQDDDDIVTDARFIPLPDKQDE
jgi:hypothetical protein